MNRPIAAKPKVQRDRAAARRERALTRLRSICLKFPECSEATSFGNPAFRAGKRAFVVLDCYKGADCIFLYADPGLRDELLKTPHYFPAPYDPRARAACDFFESGDSRLG